MADDDNNPLIATDEEEINPPEDNDSTDQRSDAPIESAKSRKKLERQLTASEVTKEAKSKLKEELAPSELRDKGIDMFFDKIFGEESSVGGFLSGVTKWVFDKTGLGQAIEWDDFEKKVNEEKTTAMDRPFRAEDYMVSHRGGKGYGDFEDNSLEGIKEAVENGREKQIEIDVRYNEKNELVLSHNPVTGEELQELPKLSEILKYLNEKAPDVTLFVDIKDKSTVDDIVKCVKDYNFESKCYFSSFNPESLKKVQEKLPDAPILFHYIPTNELNNQFKKYGLNIDYMDYISKVSDEEYVMSLCKAVDTISGDSLSLAANFEGVSVHVDDDQFPPTKKIDAKERLYLYDFLPAKPIMDMIFQSSGYISIPYQLASPELIDAAHNYRKDEAEDGIGVRVAVMAVKGSAQAQGALAMGADLVVSDNPNVIS